MPEPAPKKPEYVAIDLPLSTSDTVAGREITGVVGIVVGTTTRTTQPKVGPDTVNLLARARQDALLALADMARAAGGDAVVSVRFDGGPAADGLYELTAYGTAVTLVLGRFGCVEGYLFFERGPQAGRGSLSGWEPPAGVPGYGCPASERLEVACPRPAQ